MSSKTKKVQKLTSVTEEKASMSSPNVARVDFVKPVQLDGSEKVLLRDIWEQLNTSYRFTDWAKQNLELFKKNEDFGSFNLKGENSGRGRPAQEYWVTVNAAKEICMLSHTEEGQRVRQYFIECEKLVYANKLESQISYTPKLMDRDVLMFLIADYQKLHAEHTTALATIKEARDYAVNAAVEHGKTSAHIMKMFPEDSDLVIAEIEPEIKNPAKYGRSGLLTMGLAKYGIKAQVSVKTNKGPAKLYNLKEVEDFFKSRRAI